MLKELDEDMLLNHWTENQDMLWARQLVTMVKKKNGKLTMSGPGNQAAFILRRMVEQANEWRIPTAACWVIAMSPAELRCMARAWNELLVCAGLRITWKEAVWCTSAPTVCLQI